MQTTQVTIHVLLRPAKPSGRRLRVRAEIATCFRFFSAFQHPLKLNGCMLGA